MTDIASIISAFYSSQCIHPGRCPGLAMREQPICRSAATPDADLAVQHTTGDFWAGCFSFWALGYGRVSAWEVCTTYVEIGVAPWWFC